MRLSLSKQILVHIDRFIKLAIYNYTNPKFASFKVLSLASLFIMLNEASSFPVIIATTVGHAGEFSISWRLYIHICIRISCILYNVIICNFNKLKCHNFIKKIPISI